MKNKNGVYFGKQIGDYIFEEELGRGSFGCVYKCKNICDGSIHAIKVIEYQSLSFKGGIVGQLLKDEIHSLAKIESPNVLKLEHYLQTKNRCYIVMEYCDSGDLYQYWIKQNRILDENQVLNIIRQVLNGLKELHNNKIIHRDLKLANILLNKDQIKLADLGFCKMLNDSNIQDKLGLGSPGTIAPEVISKESYGFQSDIFSIGCIFYQLLFGELPFNYHSKELYLKQIEEQQINFKRNGVKISQNVQTIIQRMLIRDPKKRITFYELYQCDLFKKSSSIILNQNIKNEVQKQSNSGEDKMNYNDEKEQQEKATFYNKIYQKKEDEIFHKQDFMFTELNNKEDVNLFAIQNGENNQNISNSTIKLHQQIKARQYVVPLKQQDEVLDKIQNNGLQFKSIQPSSSIVRADEFKQTLKTLKFCENLYYQLKEFIKIDNLDLLLEIFMFLKSIIIQAEEQIQKIHQISLNQDVKDQILQGYIYYSSLEEFNQLISKIQKITFNKNKQYSILKELSNHPTEDFSTLFFQALYQILSYLRDETNKEPVIAKKKNIAIIMLKVQKCANFYDQSQLNINLEEMFEQITKQNIIDILKQIQCI